MLAEHFRKTLRQLDWSHAEFGKLFGVSPRTVTNYATYGMRDGSAGAILLRLVLSGKINRADIERRKWR